MLYVGIGLLPVQRAIPSYVLVSDYYRSREQFRVMWWYLTTTSLESNSARASKVAIIWPGTLVGGSVS